MPRRGARRLLLPGAVAAAVTLLAAGAAAISETAARRLLHADAEATARAWTADLGAQLGPELRALLARRPPSPQARNLLDQARRMGGVFRYELFDASGALAYVSNDLADPAGAEDRLAPHRGGNRDLAAGLLAGKPAYVEAKRGSTPNRPAYYAEALVPIAAEGEVAGVAEVHVDQSVKHALFRRVFFTAEIGMVTLVLTAGGLVGLAVRRRLREREVATTAARALAARDSLTGLLNRRGLTERLDATLAPDAGPAVLCLIDLDGFKAVNDAFGHAAGDALLRAAAERLQRTARGGRDLIARFGGDEFAVLAPLGGAGAAEPRAAAADLAGRIVAALAEPFALDGVAEPARVGASVGAAQVPADADAAGSLLRRADLALHRTKGEGRGCFRLFEEGMDAPGRERATRVMELRAAIAGGVVEPHFQPLVDLASGRLLGCEALARWHRPDRGWASPAEFVTLAEETELIWPLTESLLHRACAAAAAWPGGNLTLSFNISAVQLRERGRLAALVATALEATGLPARRLQLELTEGALTGDMAVPREVLAELKAAGLRLALDDFGTGRSGLRELQALPFDTFKLDRSFVRAANEDAAARRIVAAVVGLGQTLGLPVVAEGVEGEHDAEMLRALGCDAAQGWLFGHPKPASDADKLAAAAASPTGRDPAAVSGRPRGLHGVAAR